jgi:hypothetical protein
MSPSELLGSGNLTTPRLLKKARGKEKTLPISGKGRAGKAPKTAQKAKTRVRLSINYDNENELHFLGNSAMPPGKSDG